MQRWRSATIYGRRCFRGSAPTDDRFRLPIRSAADDRSGEPNIVTASLDGHPIPSARYVFGTLVFRFTLPRKNILQSSKRRGRAAVYGFSLMLHPLAPGTHTIHITVTHFIYKHATYILHVH